LSSGSEEEWHSCVAPAGSSRDFNFRHAIRSIHIYSTYKYKYIFTHSQKPQQKKRLRTFHSFIYTYIFYLMSNRVCVGRTRMPPLLLAIHAPLCERIIIVLKLFFWLTVGSHSISKKKICLDNTCVVDGSKLICNDSFFFLFEKINPLIFFCAWI